MWQWYSDYFFSGWDREFCVLSSLCSRTMTFLLVFRFVSFHVLSYQFCALLLLSMLMLKIGGFVQLPYQTVHSCHLLVKMSYLNVCLASLVGSTSVSWDWKTSLCSQKSICACLGQILVRPIYFKIRNRVAHLKLSFMGSEN